MQKALSVIVLLFAFVLTSTPVFAVDEMTSTPSAGTTRKPLKESFQTEKRGLQASMSAKRDELKERLTLLKDTRKKATVERISTKLPMINENATTRMSDAVTRLNAIVTKLKTDTATLKAQGVDTTAAQAAILSAEQALASASAAITAQKAKQYTLTVVSEETLKNTIGPTVKQMQADLRATHATVITARRAVYVAKMTVMQLKPNKVRLTGSPTPVSSVSGIPSVTP